MIEGDLSEAELTSAASHGLQPVVAELAAMLARLGRLQADDDEVSDSERVDRIALLEQLKAAAAGAQVAEIVQFGLSQVRSQQRADVHPRRIGRGIADQVALACRISSSAGSQRLALARALWFDLPATYAGVRSGQVSEWVATLVGRETSHLDAATRRAVDAELARLDLHDMSARRAAATTRGLAYRADPVAAVARARTEEKARRVTIRPAPDTMAVLTAYLPAAQGIAAWAALGRQADSCSAAGDPRTRGQVMADTLITRITGQSEPGDVQVEIGLLMPLESLTQPDSSRPAELHGYDPYPRHWPASSCMTPEAGCFCGGSSLPPPVRLLGRTTSSAASPARWRASSLTGTSSVGTLTARPPFDTSTTSIAAPTRASRPLRTAEACVPEATTRGRCRVGRSGSTTTSSRADPTRPPRPLPPGTPT